MYCNAIMKQLPTNTIVQCTNLGKCYQIYNEPKDRLKQIIRRGSKQYFKEFWALRDINFEIKQGESLGIIGRNGSGKSTLLQLICGTLTPTEGIVNKKGRVAALLELGSGFNPEFTGLENIYLNASMLGLTKEETNNKIDDILAFADIGDYINQPVKSYSSGMSVRLAFAVSANVDADILVIDEALSVGDAIFVQRCMRFIRKIREEKCLIFVSHDSEAIKSFCNKALWLHQGNIKAKGECKEVALDYLQYCNAVSYGEETAITALRGSQNLNLDKKIANNPGALINKSKEEYDYECKGHYMDNFNQGNGWKTGDAELKEITLTRLGHCDNTLIGGDEVELKISAIANKYIKSPIIGFLFKDKLGQNLFGENTLAATNSQREIEANIGDQLVAKFKFILPILASGTYTIMASIADGDLASNEQYHWLEEAIIVKITSSKVTYGIVGAFIQSVKLELSE